MKNQDSNSAEHEAKTVSGWARTWDTPVWLAHKSLRDMTNRGEFERVTITVDSRPVEGFRLVEKPASP